MARIARNVAEKSNDFKKLDEEMAYAVFIIEKEFNVGKIDQDFPAMKFFNLFDKVNNERYAKDSNPKSGGSSGDIKTFGRR